MHFMQNNRWHKTVDRGRSRLRFVSVLATLGIVWMSANPADAHRRPVTLPVQGLSTQTVGDVSVIVRAVPGAYDAAHALAVRLGAKTGTRLDVINGFSATLSASNARKLATDSSVAGVALDQIATPQSVSTQALSALGFDPTDNGSVSALSEETGVGAAWSQGLNGQGVDVAIIDSGIAPIPGIASDRIYYGPDLSPSADDKTIGIYDAFGHGTHLAGIIAGTDNNGQPTKNGFTGVAPASRLVPIKVSAPNGNTTSAALVAGIDWVIRNQKANGLNIKVLNLAFSAPALSDWRNDPIALSALRATRAGILVVVAAGNSGSGTSLGSPAYAPEVLSVGSADLGSSTNPNDTVVSDFSAQSNKSQPDILAPGAHIISLNVRNSYVDQTMNPVRLGDRFIRGSGTSQAAAFASGSGALLFQRYPDATGGQIAKLLRKSAQNLAGRRSRHQLEGSGVIDVARALAMPLPNDIGFARCATARAEANNDDREAKDAALQAAAPVATTTPTTPTTTVPVTTTVAAGPDKKQGRNRDELDSRSSGDNAKNSSDKSGEKSAQEKNDREQKKTQAEDRAKQSAKRALLCDLSDPSTNSPLSANWAGQQWAGQQWAGQQWAGQQWAGQQWAGQQWAGQQWAGQQWAGQQWAGQQWAGQQWAGQQWAGQQWASQGWI